MLDLVDNEAVVLAVLGDRYRLPVERLAPGQVAVAEAAQPGMPVRALARRGGAVVAVAPAWGGLLREHLDGAGSLEAALAAVAGAIGGHHFSWVARTGVAIAAPEAEVTVLDTTDPRLPEWVIGHFSGEAWVVLGDDGQVLSTAVLKRYDDRLREISVGTSEAARGRGLAKAVTAAAARAVLAEGRAVLYNHDATNHTSARVAEAVGLHEFGRCHAVVTDTDPDPGVADDARDSTST
ncbi:MAG TPA: GNAT family N-acetyltransferase [Actinomycetota bacterium]|nr:GNAT family N-acetyltransferase [Actinomycetota bacterium]